MFDDSMQQELISCVNTLLITIRMGSWLITETGGVDSDKDSKQATAWTQHSLHVSSISSSMADGESWTIGFTRTSMISAIGPTSNSPCQVCDGAADRLRDGVDRVLGVAAGLTTVAEQLREVADRVIDAGGDLDMVGTQLVGSGSTLVAMSGQERKPPKRPKMTVAQKKAVAKRRAARRRETMTVAEKKAAAKKLRAYENATKKRAPAKKKAPAKKSPAKTTATKKRAPAKKTPAKRAPAKKTPAKKSPTKKRTPAKKAPAKRAPAKRAPAKKTPAKKKAPAKKGTATRRR